MADSLPTVEQCHLSAGWRMCFFDFFCPNSEGVDGVQLHFLAALQVVASIDNLRKGLIFYNWEITISPGANVMIFDRRKSDRRKSERRHIERGTDDRRHVNRRQLLKLGTIATLASLVRHPLLASASQKILPCRDISLLNIHTGEKLSVEYCAEGEYYDDALLEINHILRDFRTGEVKAIDPQLLNLLHAITTKINPGSQIHIISGYRSPATNLALAKQSGGVASKSLHMDGKAVDIRIPGCDLNDLRKVTLGMRVGGVGYYAKSNFVHVDTGRVRFW